jgi:uncharacterized protein YjiS (DUF1127 family)
MPKHDKIDFSTFDYRALTLDEINELKTAALRRAHEERTEYLRSLPRALGGVLRGLWAVAGRAWTAHRARRRWQAEIAELRGLDERALKDIGVTRFDVNALAHARPCRPNK